MDIVIIIIAVVVIILAISCLYRYKKYGKMFGGETTSIKYRRTFMTPIIQSAIDEVTTDNNRFKFKYSSKLAGDAAMSLREFERALRVYNSNQTDDDDREDWKELMLPLAEAIVTMYVDEGTLIRCERVLGAGSYNLVFALKDGRVLRVFKYDRRVRNYKETVINNAKNIRQMYGEMRNELGFPQIYNGSHNHKHNHNADNEVGWLIVKKYQPFTFELAKEHVKKYYETMMRIIDKLHQYKLAYADWKITNMMWDQDLQEVVLTDIDFEDLNGVGHVKTHQIKNWESLTRAELDKTVIKKEIRDIYRATNSKGYWGAFVKEKYAPTPAQIEADFKTIVLE